MNKSKNWGKAFEVDSTLYSKAVKPHNEFSAWDDLGFGLAALAALVFPIALIVAVLFLIL